MCVCFTLFVFFGTFLFFRAEPLLHVSKFSSSDILVTKIRPLNLGDIEIRPAKITMVIEIII